MQNEKVIKNIVSILDSYLDYESVGCFNIDMLLNEDLEKIKTLLSNVENKDSVFKQALKMACNRYSIG